MKPDEREALGRAIARVIDTRVAEMRERMAAIETQLAEVPTAIERCAPRDLVESVCQSLETAHGNTEKAQSEFRAALADVTERLGDVNADTETRVREASAEVLEAVLRRQQEAAAEAIASIRDKALEAWARVGSVKDGERGPRGKQGEPGPPGTLAQVRTWQAGEIYRAGEYVWLPPGHPHGWAMACAMSETYDIPGDDGAPWEPYLFHGERGEPGAGMRYRGAHVTGGEYALGDVVIGEAGSAWVRTVEGVSDALPGDGWGLLAKRGERGTRGKPGANGAPGRPGADGVGIADIAIEGDALVVTLTNGDVKALQIPVLFVRGAP